MPLIRETEIPTRADCARLRTHKYPAWFAPRWERQREKGKEDEEQLFDLVSHQPVTFREAAEHLKIGERRATRYLLRLWRKERVRRIDLNVGSYHTRDMNQQTSRAIFFTNDFQIVPWLAHGNYFKRITDRGHASQAHHVFRDIGLSHDESRELIEALRIYGTEEPSTLALCRRIEPGWAIETTEEELGVKFFTIRNHIQRLRTRGLISDGFTVRKIGDGQRIYIVNHKEPTE